MKEAVAKDLMSAVYTEEGLRKKYGNFLVPAAKILIGDSEKNLLEEYRIPYEDIRITLGFQEAASANFSITNVYDLEKRSLKDSVSEVICPGNRVKIELGYLSELTVVFLGYIQEVSMQFGEESGMQVTAVDARRLMAENSRQNYVWGGKKYSEVFTALMKDYEKLADVRGNVEATKAELKKPLIQKGSDMDMVKQLCQMSNRNFFVCGDKAYFKESMTESPVTTLSWGQSLLSFSKTPVYVDITVEVWGNLKGSDEKLAETRTVATEGSMKHAIPGGVRKIVIMTDVESADELKERADREEKALIKQAKAGSGSCVGIPVLFPGRHVRIEGLGADINGDYFLESVTHSFGSGGFTTDFLLGRGDSGFYGGFLDLKEEKEEKGQTVQSVMKGKVTKNWDSGHPGMVEVEVLLGEKEKSNIGWVPVASSYAGNGFGAYLLPEIGSYVLLAFDMGRLKSPYVIGCLWNQTNVIPEETANEKNTGKVFLTKGGNRIAVSDEEGKERIELSTKGELSVLLEEENQKITVADKDGKNAMQIDAKEGIITFAAEKKAVFKIKNKEMLTLDGSASKAGIAADKVSAEAGQKLLLKGQNTSLEGSSTSVSGQNIKLEAQASLALKGTASVKAESSGIMELKGAMMKLNG